MELKIAKYNNSQNEYWGSELFLRKAIPADVLITDTRSARDKEKIRKSKNHKPRSGLILDYSESGVPIINLIDTPQSLTAFEDWKQ